MAMIKTLSQFPKAAILINSDISSQFNLTRGAWQGFPLSPLLFALVIEPLATAIRSNPHIHGVLVGNVKQRCYIRFQGKQQKEYHHASQFSCRSYAQTEYSLYRIN